LGQRGEGKGREREWAVWGDKVGWAEWEEKGKGNFPFWLKEFGEEFKEI
jgi:hypothetical protein